MEPFLEMKIANRPIERAWSCLHALYTYLSCENTFPHADFFFDLRCSRSVIFLGSVIIPKPRIMTTHKIYMIVRTGKAYSGTSMFVSV